MQGCMPDQVDAALAGRIDAVRGQIDEQLRVGSRTLFKPLSHIESSVERG